MNTKTLILTMALVCSAILPMAAPAGFREELLENGLPIINAVDEKDILPFGFRMTKVITLPQSDMPSVEGLENLNMSGSSQFSELSLDALIKRIGKKHITIVNLRQEDGGFIQPEEGLGAIAFSYLMPMPWWTGEDPRGNRTIEEIERSEEARMQGIMQEKNFTMYAPSDSYAPTDTHTLLYRVDVVAKRAFTEKQLVQEKGLGYFRIPDKKFGNMEYEHVDLFVDFVKSLPKDEWVHFHCKKGQSRTTLFMIMYDMMKNADKVSPTDIIKRQGPLGLGGADLYGLPEKEAWDISFKRGWKEFLYQFHAYVLEQKSQNYAKSWTQWAEDNNIPPLPPVVLGDYYQDTTVASILPEEDQVQMKGTLVINMINESKLAVQNFRTTKDLWLDKSVKFSSVGFDEMNASGSNQYSQEGLKLLINKLKKRAKNIVVVDLRHDDHLFVNGLNFSSFETKEALLEPRSPELIKASEQALKHEILSHPGVMALAIDTKYPKNTYDTRFSVSITPQTVETPEEFVNSLGINYLLIGSKRFSEASDSDVDNFIEYYKKMPKDTWYHFHCKKGKSRTTLYLTLFDMMLNAEKVSFEDILSRQRVIGGSDLLDITPKDPSWPEEKESKKQWIVFLVRFYEYAKEQKASGFATSWEQWSEEHADFQPNVDHLAVDKNG